MAPLKYKNSLSVPKCRNKSIAIVCCNIVLFMRLVCFCLRVYSVAEVASMLEDDDFQNADIFILPPEDATRSDEDSGPEDDDGDIDNLSGN